MPDKVRREHGHLQELLRGPRDILTAAQRVDAAALVALAVVVGVAEHEGDTEVAAGGPGEGQAALAGLGAAAADDLRLEHHAHELGDCLLLFFGEKRGIESE